MIGTVLDKVASRVDQRLLTTLLFPGFVFVAGVGALVATELGWSKTLSWWSQLDGPRRALLVAAGTAAVLLATTILAVRIRSMIQFYEGLSRGPVGRVVALVGGPLQRWRRDRALRRDDSDEELFYGFPPAPTPLLPTRLGNVLRAAESYPESRYGLDGVFFWPRLFPLLPDALRTAVADARADLERQVVVCSLALSFCAVSAGFAVFGDIRLAVWLPSVAGSLLLALTAYRGAVLAAVGYGDLVRSSYDLYRRALLKALDYAIPATLEDEQALWSELGKLLYRGLAEEPERLMFAPPAN